MGILVKICGINSLDVADAAARAGADFAGLNFHPASPRYVAHEQATALAGRLRGRVRLVALMSDPTDGAIAAALQASKPDFLQLHGRESAERLNAIKATFGVAIIKAIAIAAPADLAEVHRYEALADMILLDAKAPAGADRAGGHGIAFDWRILAGQTFSRPWLLAGGLNADNVARAIEVSSAPGVDVSSGVEDAPGQKNAAKIAAFIDAVRTPHVGAAA